LKESGTKKEGAHVEENLFKISQGLESCL
jgi:hypothetical protein